MLLLCDMTIPDNNKDHLIIEELISLIDDHIDFYKQKYLYKLHPLHMSFEQSLCRNIKQCSKPMSDG